MKRYPLLVIFVLICAVSHAQNTGAFLVPRVVYVGDPATLVLPLPGQDTAVQGAGDIILVPQSPDFPSDIDIDFRRIVLERRVSGSRLLIEFTAFVPGLLELPDIEIGGGRFSGLTVTISSIIDSTESEPELSAPASPLAMPGTALMIYGTMAAFVFLLLLTLWFFLRGRCYLNTWIAKWKRWRLFISMKNAEKRLYRALLKGMDNRVILDKLSDEFRLFLTFFTGSNCRAMTAREFERLPSELFSGHDFVGGFFHRSDELRFSGRDVNTEDVFRLLADLRLFLGALEKAGKGRNNIKEELAA
jgi:hypothetical protein